MAAYNILAHTRDMTRDDWLKLRTQGIGGSDVSIIAGINKYRSAYQLWLEKTGQIEPEEVDNDYVHFGTILEPIVRKEFMERTGIKVRQKHMILQSVEYPFMTANLDGVINENGDTAIFEAKTASAFKEDVWTEEVPAEYMLQIQHYMFVTGAKRAYIAALVGGNHFYYHKVERDDDMIAKIVTMEKCFWEQNVIAGVEPTPDGSEATTNYLNERFGASNGETIVLPDDAQYICSEYEEVSRQIKELEKKKSEAANKLKFYLKEAETGTVGNWEVSWKTILKSSFDSTRLKMEQPELYNSYMKDSSYRRLSVA